MYWRQQSLTGVPDRFENGIPAGELLFEGLLLGDVHHHAAQAHRVLVLENHRDDVAEPDGAPVGGDHPVFELMIAPLCQGSFELANYAIVIVGMQEALPEARFARPPLRGVSQQSLGLVAGEDEVHRPGVHLP